MDKGGYQIRNQGLPHFITFAVTGWIDVFTRKLYRDTILDSLSHCQAKKGLLVHCWCIMSNHLHLILSARNNDLSKVLGEFKTYTSKQILASIGANTHESRKEWMLELFSRAGEANPRNKNY